MTRFAVYDLVENGEIVYVGFTENPDKRLSTHRQRGLCSRAAFLRVVSWHLDRGAARAAETFRISTLKPERNVTHKRCLGLRKPCRAMLIEDARKVWGSSSESERDADVLTRMPGWTLNMARHHFGNRVPL